MTVSYTLKTHQSSRPGGVGTLALQEIVDGLPADAREVLDNESRNPLCTGELYLYRALTQDGVAPSVAAQAAVLFPEPSFFAPPHSNQGMLALYCLGVVHGASPLDALAKASAVCSDYTCTPSVLAKRQAAFAQFVEANR